MAVAGVIPGALIGGTYRLLRPLGPAGGRVHEARHDRLSGRFAVKLFGAVEPRAFERNAELASALHHPGIVQVLDYSATQGQAFVVMEYVEGRALSVIIGESGLLSADRVGRLIEGVATGLQAAHDGGLAHGHLSPERIFVLPARLHDGQGGGSPDERTKDERTKIVGFGLEAEPSSAASDGLSDLVELTELTPYTAPEQLTDDADAASDQFALAAIAYEMLTGVPPFDDSTERRAPPSIRDFAPEVNVIVDDVIRRALAADAGARWPDVLTFARRLREATEAGAHEENTRLAPIPLTLTPTSPRPNRERAAPPRPALPEIASVEIDLAATPPPARPLPALFSASPKTWQSAPGRATASLPTPTRLPPPTRGPAPPRRSTMEWPIAPLPTFSFSEGLETGPVARPGRRSSGGRWLPLLVVMTVAGLAGFFCVRYRVWQGLEPLVDEAGQVARSVRSRVLGRGADAPATEPGAGGPGAAPSPADAPELARVAPPPVSRPEVVPIQPLAPPPPPAGPRLSSSSSHRSSSSAHAHRTRNLPPLSDEAAAEEALLAAPTPAR